MNTLKTGSIALAVILFIAMPLAAHAADIADGGSSYDYSYPVDSGSSYDYSYPVDTGSSYDYSYPVDSGYTTGGYSTGYLSGSGYMGGGYLAGNSYIPSMPSNVYAPSNTCVNNSCNTNINAPTTVNAPTVITTYPSTPVYNYPTPVCSAGFYGTYPNCYRPAYTPPIAYNQTPYIALSAVPYTGLDLGFWGTIAYWGFLILWCLVAAYLVVVKKVQNRILRSLNSFLFGDSASTSHTVAAAAPVAPVHTYSVPVPLPVDAIDPFIVSQINRVRA
jgi:hypothetical protein